MKKVFLLGLLLGLFTGFLGFPLAGSGLSSRVLSDVKLSEVRSLKTPDTVAKGDLAVPVIAFQLSVRKAVTLDTLRIKSILVENITDIESVHLLINGRDEKTVIMNNDTREAVFADLNLRLLSGDQPVFEVRIDIRKTLSREPYYQFAVEPAFFTFEEGPLLIEGKPVKGKTFRVYDVALGSLTIKNASDLTKTPLIGAKGQTIARFVLEAGNRDLILKRLRLSHAGELSTAELKNFRLVLDGETVSMLPTWDEKGQLSFVLGEGKRLKKNKSKKGSVVADVLRPWKVEAVKLFLDEEEDLLAVDSEYGSGAPIINDYSFDKAWCTGAKSPTCPAEGFKKRCTKDEIKARARDC